MQGSIVRGLLACALASVVSTGSRAEIGASIIGSRAAVRAGAQELRFERASSGTWSLTGAFVRGKKAAIPVGVRDSFLVGGGDATDASVSSTPGGKAITFRLARGVVTYRVSAADPLPFIHVEISGLKEAAVAFQTPAASADEHGAWATRGETASDAEGREVFIDGSGPVVFGHSAAGGLDTDYVLLAEVNRHIQGNGRTEQRSSTFFRSERSAGGGGAARGVWRLRMTGGEPTRFALLFDTGLGRFSAVCEKYYAGVADTLVDIRSVASGFNRGDREPFDPAKMVEVLPLRLAAPDAFIPGRGWTMEEYPDAAYPYGHDSAIQTGNLLVYEGLTTGRSWERNFGKWALDNTPLLGPDGRSFFVRRPGGITRWGYASDYKNGFIRLDGANWGDSEALYATADITGDAELKALALEMMKHDVDVKLDLDHMTFPPCWDVIRNAPGDHRDDWATTTLLAYAAELCSQVLAPETGDRAYIRKADRICDWFLASLGRERKMNFLNDGVNLYNCWAGWIPAALVHRYERSGDRSFLDAAKDVFWVQMLALALTKDHDSGGTPLAGVTCVGVRGCVDYDCAPNLCQEKDGFFVAAAGSLLAHVSGPAYARCLLLQRYALPRDRWNDAFGVQELRGTNLRTMYDNYPRALANLAFALDSSSNPLVVAVDRSVLDRRLDTPARRQILLANATSQPQATRASLNWLRPGTWRLARDGKPLGDFSAEALERGIPLRQDGDSSTVIEARLISAAPVPSLSSAPSASLSDLNPSGAQRGVGLPQPVCQRDRSFGGKPLSIGGKSFAKGLGCAHNTALVYDLGGRYGAFDSTVGVDDGAGPSASVAFTVFVDGVCRFDSGVMTHASRSKAVHVDVRGAKTLMLRLSSAWDNNGRSDDDLGDWVDAKLTGDTMSRSHIAPK